MAELQSSPHSSPIEAQGRTFDVQIHRLEGEADWVLEIVDDLGTSFCFEDRFADDADALAEARRAIEAGECMPLDPAAEEVQAAFARAAGCSALAHPAAYVLGYFTASITLPPLQHGVRVFTDMLDPEAETADLEHTTRTLANLFEALAITLECETVDLSHLSVKGLAEWAQGYMAYVASEPRWESSRTEDDELDPIEAFAAPGLTDLPDAFEDLTEAHGVLAEGATVAFALWADERDASLESLELDEPLEPLEPEAEPFRREAAKVGRNEPCPCGSGKKYKKCCLRK